MQVSHHVLLQVFRNKTSDKVINQVVPEIQDILALIFLYLAIRPVGPNGKIDLYCFVHVHKKYKSRVGDRQIGVCGLLAKNAFGRCARRLYLLLHKATVNTVNLL